MKWGKVKKILVIIVLVMLGTSIFNASEIPEAVCPIVNDFSNTEPGDGGQDYITDVPIDIEYYPVVNEVVSIDLYDWFNEYVETVVYDTTPRVMGNGIGYEYFFTGLVDGTYTFIIDNTYKGTFNVNHEYGSAVYINMSMYTQCYHDAYGNYIDPNTTIDGFYDYPQDNHDDDNYYGYDYNNDNDSGNSMTNIESATQSETNSYTEITEQSEEERSEALTYEDEQSFKFKVVILMVIIPGILLVVIFGLIAVIYILKKSNY